MPEKRDLVQEAASKAKNLQADEIHSEYESDQVVPSRAPRSINSYIN